MNGSKKSRNNHRKTPRTTKAADMQVPTYYAALGLAPNAPPEVIRAAYKALALIYHPDKTLELAAADRAAHGAIFRDLQEAFDVLSKPNLKAAYDAELARHDGNVDDELSTFHHPAPSTPKRKTPVKLTTPEVKEAMVARARQQLEYLRKQRVKRQDDEANMDIAELRKVADTWCNLADENDADPTIQAHCTVRAHEYLERIAEREQQHEEWLKQISKSKHALDTAATPATPDTKGRRYLTPNAPEKLSAATRGEVPSTPRATKCEAHRPATPPSPTPTSRIDQRTAERKRAVEKRTEEAKARAEIRRARKVQLEAAKQAKVEQKAALVRAEKEKQRAKVEEQARLNAESTAKTRAKVHATPLRTNNDVAALYDEEETMMTSSSDARVHTTDLYTVNKNVQDDFKLSANRACARCGIEHEGFREWNKCRMRAGEKSKDTRTYE
jgi:curved DNA-binding protein CbpA